jgi:hypothetical protein
VRIDMANAATQPTRATPISVLGLASLAELANAVDGPVLGGRWRVSYLLVASGGKVWKPSFSKTAGVFAIIGVKLVLRPRKPINDIATNRSTAIGQPAVRDP